MPIFDIEHPDGRKFEVDAPDINAAAEAVGGFGPSSDQGGSKISRFLTNIYNNPPPTIAAVRDIIKGARPASMELVNPASPDTAREAAGTMLGAAALGTPASPALRAGQGVAGVPLSHEIRPPAIPATELQSQAGAGMNALREENRAIPVRPDALEGLAGRISEFVNKNGPSRKEAPIAHAEIDNIAKTSRTGDLGDIVESRKVLRRLQRTGKGDDRAAARLAANQIDQTLIPAFPGLVQKLQELDKNFAIGMDAAKIDQKIADAILQAETTGSQGNVGNKIKQAISPMLQKGRAEKLAPEVRAAAENVVHPGAGVRALQILSALDPTSSKLMGAITMRGYNPLTIPLSVPGAASRMMYDRILKNRAGGISEAMRQRAPASMAQPGTLPLPPLQYPAPGMGLAPLFPNEQ